MPKLNPSNLNRTSPPTPCYHPTSPVASLHPPTTMHRHRGAGFHAVSTSCLWWWRSLHNRDFRPINAPLRKPKTPHWVSAGCLTRCRPLSEGCCREAAGRPVSNASSRTHRPGISGNTPAQILLHFPKHTRKAAALIKEVTPSLLLTD